jgi:hypothetical protein
VRPAEHLEARRRGGHAVEAEELAHAAQRREREDEELRGGNRVASLVVY